MRLFINKLRSCYLILPLAILLSNVSVHATDSNRILDAMDHLVVEMLTSSSTIKTHHRSDNVMQQTESFLIYSRAIEDETFYYGYNFNADGLLVASVISFPDTEINSDCADIFLYSDNGFLDVSTIQFKVYSHMEVANDESTGKIITVSTSSDSEGKNPIRHIGFSYYEENNLPDGVVDLGLSVAWSEYNLGSQTPEGVGAFFAFSETGERSEYWIDNYSYSNNNDNKYVFKYNNPLKDISGTKYDAATKRLGIGWRMPTLEEAIELLNSCEWEATDIGNMPVYKVTGPNGNCIYIPRVGFKKQDQGYKIGSYNWRLAIGSSLSMDSDGCYVFSEHKSNGKATPFIDSGWKCWGYNIRPVYEMK